MAILGSVVVAVTAFDLLWRSLDDRPPDFDQANHLGDSLVYLHLFRLGNPLPFFDTRINYPPLVYWITDAFYAATGDHALWIAILSNVVWTSLLVFATYKLGEALWSPRVGLLSVAFVITAPMVVSTLKSYMLDVPLAATVALSLYLLVRSKSFVDRKYSLLFGASCGIGLLVKWTFPFVLVLPVLQASAAALHEARMQRKLSTLANLAGAAALTVAVAGIWYLPNLGDIISQQEYKGYVGAPVGFPAVASLRSLTFYAWTLLDVQLSIVPLLFLLAGIGFCLWRRDAARRNLYPILTIVGTYICFTLIRDKDARFTLPMLPAVAVIATSWVELVGSRARRALSGFVVAYGIAAFFVISFGTSLLPSRIDLPLGSSPLLGDGIGGGKVTLFTQTPYIIGAPVSQSWHQEDAFRAMQQVPPAQRRFDYLGASTLWFNIFGIRYYALRYDATWTRAGAAHFLLVRGHPRGVPTGLSRVEEWTLPGGAPLTLYQRDARRLVDRPRLARGRNAVADDGARVDARHDQPVRQRKRRHLDDVLTRHGRAVREAGVCLGRCEQVNRCAGARAERDAGCGSRAADDVDDEGDRVVRRRGRIEILLRSVQAGDVEKRRNVPEDVWGETAMRQPEDGALDRRTFVVQMDLEQETVELGLGQREDARLLVGVLRRDHHERRRQPVHPALDGHVPLLHRLEQRRLRPRRSPVDLVCEDDVRKERPLHEGRLAAPDHAAAGDLLRRGVGGELDALEVHAEHAGDRAGHQRLRDARRALDQDVAAGDGRDQEQIDRLLVADDHPFELASRLLAEVEQRVPRVHHGARNADREPARPLLFV